MDRSFQLTCFSLRSFKQIFRNTDMDELSCPRCRMTKYRNPSLRLMINTCGHALCEACVELIFTRESAPCPDCGRTIRRNGFRIQLFEDTRVDKEVDIRKGVLRVYNKQESDFSNLKEYNDYLEEIEDIIWNLETGRNEKETREKIAQYKQENETLIRKNQVRMNQERNYFKEQLAKQERDRQIRAQLLVCMDKEAEVARKRVQEELLNDLTNNTSISSAEVLARHKRLKADDEKSRTLLDEKMQISISSGFHADTGARVTNSIAEEECLFEYEPIIIDIIGPNLPDRNTVIESGYLRNVRDATASDLGGGYNSMLACNRALNDAFGGLFVSPSSRASEVL